MSRRDHAPRGGRTGPACAAKWGLVTPCRFPVDRRNRKGYLGIVMKKKCPHCGNKDAKLIQSNGEQDSSPDLTLLCVARVKPAEWSFSDPPEPDMVDAAGLVPCGMQWEPNS